MEKWKMNVICYQLQNVPVFLCESVFYVLYFFIVFHFLYFLHVKILV